MMNRGSFGWALKQLLGKTRRPALATRVCGGLTAIRSPIFIFYPQNIAVKWVKKLKFHRAMISLISHMLSKRFPVYFSFPLWSLILFFVGSFACASPGDPSNPETDELKAIKSLAQCLRRDKNNQDCAQQYERKVKDYLKPRCLRLDIEAEFEIYAARSSADEYFKKVISYKDQVYYIPKTSEIDAKDVQDIHFDQSVGGDLINLTSSGAAKLKKFSEANIGQRAAVVLGRKVLSAPILHDVIESSSLVIVEPESSLRQICLKIKTLTLPDEAKVR